MKKHMMFDGEWFTNQFGRYSKKEAEEDAKLFRRKGYHVRIKRYKTNSLAKHRYVHQIFTRRKK